MDQQSQKIKLFILITVLLIFILIGFVAVIIFLFRKKQVNYFKDLSRIKNDYEKNLLSAQLEIQEQTLQNISREIHDNISISLTLAKLQLNTLNTADTASIQKLISSSVDLISKSILDLSDLSKSYNTDAIRENGLYNTLKQEIKRIETTGLHHLVFHVTGTPVFLHAQKELIIFRIAQEALNNVLKHAQAPKITVSLCYEPEHLVFCIRDNGIGFNQELVVGDRKTSMKAGLTNIQTRAAAINSKCTIKSSPGNGTIVCVDVPYEKMDNFGKNWQAPINNPL
jgi:two-component system, NarL family, sensor kinase